MMIDSDKLTLSVILKDQSVLRQGLTEIILRGDYKAQETQVFEFRDFSICVTVTAKKISWIQRLRTLFSEEFRR